MIPCVIPRPVRTLVVGISWYNFTCSGRLTIEVTAYYEIATGAAHPRNDTRFGSFISHINNPFCMNVDFSTSAEYNRIRTYTKG